MKKPHSPRSFRVARYAAVAYSLSVFPMLGATVSTTASVTSLGVLDQTGPASSITTPGAGTTSFPSGTQYTVNYGGTTRSIVGFTAGGIQYVPLSYAGTITTTLRRQSSADPNVGTQSPNNVVYHRVTANNPTTTYDVAGPQFGNQQAAFNKNNLNLGTDNLFTNQGNASGNVNNIERVDVTFSNGLVVTTSNVFTIFERGAVNGHDGFKIAAITAIDALGNPTSFGSLITFASGSYGTTALDGSPNWLVQRNVTNGGEATSPSESIVSQSIGGTTVSIHASTAALGLGIPLGNTIYGYSIFGQDTVATNPGDLTNLNSTAYPKNTADGNTNGGIDLIAYTGVAFNAVPEPSITVLLAGFGALVALRRRR